MDDDIEDFGPAMRALTEKQRRFVLALMMQTRKSPARAARTAGYSDVKDGAKVRGFHLIRHEKVVEAVREEARRRIDGAAYLAADVLVGIAADPTAPLKERRAAAGMLLDRTAGFGTQQDINIHKTVTDRTGAAMIERIKVLALELGVDPARLLGRNTVEEPAPMKLIEGVVVHGDRDPETR